MGEICKIQTGKKNANESDINGEYNFYTCSIKPCKSKVYSFNGECILIIGNGSIGESFYVNEKFEAYQRTYVLNNFNNVNVKYLYYYIKMYFVKYCINLAVGSVIKFIKLDNILNFEISLPPLQIQNEIVLEIEKIENYINKGQELLQELLQYKRSVLHQLLNPEKQKLEEEGWRRVKLGEMVEIILGQSPQSIYYNQNENGMLFYQGKTNFGSMYLKKTDVYTTKTTKNSIKGDILMSVRAPVGDVNINSFDEICIGRGLALIRVNINIVNQLFIYYYLVAIKKKIKGNGGTIFDSICKNDIANIEISLPPLPVQNEIVSKIEKIENVINNLTSQVKDEYSLLGEYKKSVLNKILNGRTI